MLFRILYTQLTKLWTSHRRQTSLQKELARASAKLNLKERLHTAAKDKLENLRGMLQGAEKATRDAEQREHVALVAHEEAQDVAGLLIEGRATLEDSHALKVLEWARKLESEKRQTRRVQSKLDEAEARIIELEELLRSAESRAAASTAAMFNTELAAGTLRQQLVGSRERVRALQMKCSRADTVRENTIKRAVLKTRKVSLTHSLIKKGTYTSAARALVRILHRAGCAQAKIGKAVHAVARTLGVHLKHREMSRRTVLRCLAEGGLVAQIQLGHEIKQAKSEFSPRQDTTVHLPVLKRPYTQPGRDDSPERQLRVASCCVESPRVVFRCNRSILYSTRSQGSPAWRNIFSGPYK